MLLGDVKQALLIEARVGVSLTQGLEGSPVVICCVRRRCVGMVRVLLHPLPLLATNLTTNAVMRRERQDAVMHRERDDDVTARGAAFTAQGTAAVPLG